MGGRLIWAAGVVLRFGLTERGSSLHAISTIPEFLFEPSLGI